MKISAVISEFNPFHLGHQYLINKIRENGTTHIVAVMSGNFVQRGEPAMFSKWSRAKMALTSGVDLVIEIPVAMSVSTAQRYAYKGIEIVNSLGCVDALCFGSECGDTKALEIVSDALLENHIFDDIKSYLSRGMTYAKARECAIDERLGLGFKGIVCQPNNILAIEYIKAIKQMKCEFSFETISRVGAQHDSKNRSGDGIVSASLIRDFVKKNIEICGYVPSESEKIILRETELGNAPADILNVERAVLAKMRSLDVQDILNLPDISEGIEHRILNAVKDARSIDDLYFKILVINTFKYINYIICDFNKRIFFNHLSVNLNPLPKVYNRRRSVKSSFVAALLHDRCQHSTNRTLTVRPGNVDKL